MGNGCDKKQQNSCRRYFECGQSESCHNQLSYHVKIAGSSSPRPIRLCILPTSDVLRRSGIGTSKRRPASDTPAEKTNIFPRPHHVSETLPMHQLPFPYPATRVETIRRISISICGVTVVFWGTIRRNPGAWSAHQSWLP